MSEFNDIDEIPEGTFPINLKFIQKHQRSEPIITAKYKDDTYHKGYFCEGSNIDLILTNYKVKINITTFTKTTLMVRIIFIFSCYDRFRPLMFLDQF